MDRVSLRDLQRITPTLAADEFAAISRRILGLRTPEQAGDVKVADRLRILFWEWLLHLGFISDGQAAGILAEVPFAEAARLLSGPDGERPSSFHCWIADHRYVRWAADGGAVYDLVDAASIAAIPEPPVTVIVCDLVALYGRALRRLRALKETADDDAQGRGRPGPAAR